MSLVGPRPEVRHYVDYWTPEQMRVLDVRPGITDPASIKFRNENELMAQADDPEQYYINVIMQEKLRLYLEYVDNQSFLYDLRLIFATLRVVITEWRQWVFLMELPSLRYNNDIEIQRIADGGRVKKSIL